MSEFDDYSPRLNVAGLLRKGYVRGIVRALDEKPLIEFDLKRKLGLRGRSINKELTYLGSGYLYRGDDKGTTQRIIDYKRIDYWKKITLVDNDLSKDIVDILSEHKTSDNDLNAVDEHLMSILRFISSKRGRELFEILSSGEEMSVGRIVGYSKIISGDERAIDKSQVGRVAENGKLLIKKQETSRGIRYSIDEEKISKNMFLLSEINNPLPETYQF